MSEAKNSTERVLETLEDLKKSLEQLTETPTTAANAAAVQVRADAAQGIQNQGITPQVRQLMSGGDLLDMRRKLRKLSTPELQTLLSIQINKEETGVPYEAWVRAGGALAANAVMQSPELTKALDSTGATALIRQDLEPVLYELYVREFPAFDRFSREPANGLVHAFNQITSYGDAKFLSELGTVTDDQSTYVRQTTNVAIIATRRGVSLKSQFAVLAGGAGYNPLQLELQGGMRAMAHRVQKTIFEGNASNSGASGTDELGLAYDANAFTGLRAILNTARAQNADPTAATPDDMRTAFDRAAEQIQGQGGRASIIWAHPHEKVSFDLQQDKNVRYMNSWVDVAPGVQTNAVNTVFGPLPIATVPGDSISTYTSSNYSGNTVRDVYVLDEGTISLPYLGSEGPTVLDIPIGISGQLTHQYIMFGMWGLAVKAIPFSNKVRIKQ